jgi:outer membrane translocation and assembly module TamA
VKKLLFSLIAIVFLSFLSIGQKKIVFYQKNGVEFPTSVSKYLETQSTNQVNKSVQLIRNQCIEKGYFLCDLQLSQTSDDCDSFLVNLGNQYKGLTLMFNDRTEQVLKSIYPSQRNLLKETQEMSPAQYLRFMNQVLNFHLEHGFPFCRVYLKQVETRTDLIEAELVVEQGPHYVWTEIHLKNELPVSMNTLQSIIGIRLNDAYNEALFNAIEQRVIQTGIFALKKKCEVLFTDKGAELFVYLERVKASSAQGIVGFQPNPLTNAPTFTGDMQLKLINSVKHNESFEFAWKSIQPRTQALQSSLIVPYLFKSPFGVIGDFQLYKRDSSFLDVKSTLGIQFQFQNGWQLRANYYFVNSSVISQANANPMFSKLASLKTNSYGLVLFQRKLDYIPNPRKGFSVFMEGQLGERKMEQSSESIWKTQASISYFLPLAGRMTFLTHFELDSYHAPSIYQNELYRFGGANSLRGFNEESLFATTKAFLTFEYRFLLDKNSAVFAFFNQGFYENTSVNYTKDHPFGFGFGISAGTNLGIFRLAYALGKEFNNPIQLNAGKIHIGYISYF